MGSGRVFATFVITWAAMVPASNAATDRKDSTAVASQGLRGSKQVSLADVTTQEVERSLISELAGNVSSQRLDELEALLKPMYTALPKGPEGGLGHQAVRYALHRLLLERHGWFIVGLEPTDDVPPPYLHGEWVPEYLQGLLEQRLSGRGVALREVAALAAALEDLVGAEAARRLDLLYARMQVELGKRLDTNEAERLIETYMMMYFDDGNFTMPTQNLDLVLKVFKKEYDSWDTAQDWMEKIKQGHVKESADGRLDHAEMVKIAKELGERFGAFNDGECRNLKRELLTLESSKPARVPLLDFYKKGLYSHWEMNERSDYLRAIGALDETDPQRPQVVVPNYLAARTNCLTASKLYSVCCRNECEDLMGHLEQQIAAPSALPGQILDLVSQLGSDTVNASRTLPETLRQRLSGIAARHNGKVPLHGRLFAQWMHHAYPRECPFPHEGDKNPLTPDEWMREAGEEEARVSEAQVRQLLGSCGTAQGLPCDQAQAGATQLRAATEELPWSDLEVMLTPSPAKQASGLWALAGKLCILAVLVVFLKQRLSEEQGKGKGGLIDDMGHSQPKQRNWQLLAGMVGVGLMLEILGVLDRRLLAVTLVGGLVLNLGLPVLLGHLSKQGLKTGKCV